MGCKNMNDVVYSQGDVLSISIPEEWQPSKQIANRTISIQNRGVVKVIILEHLGDGVYMAVPCFCTPVKKSIPIKINGANYYARICRVFVDYEILSGFGHEVLDDKDKVLDTVYQKLKERTERNRQSKERRRERKKNAPSISEILYNWPTKEIAEARRQLQANKVADFSTEKNTAAKAYEELPRCINGYKIVPLHSLNSKGFMHGIILTNYVRDGCVVCGKRLVKYINFIPISKTQALRVPGKLCTKCDLFFEERGPALYETCKAFLIPPEYHISQEYLIPDYSTRIKISKTKKSASLAVHLKTRDIHEHRFVTIVSSRSDRDIEHDIFHYSDYFARLLLLAICRKKESINITGDTFNILKVFRLDWANDSLERRMNIKKIVLHNGGGLYNELSSPQIELVDILLYSPFTECFEVTHASYDTENDQYYMDARVLRSFITKYGNPGVEIAAYKSGYRDFSTMKEESILHAYGYVVGNAGLSERERQVLLGEVLDLGLMSATSILSLLDLNITMHSGDRYQYARSCWIADRTFVMEYKVNPNRFVISTIGIHHS